MDTFILYHDYILSLHYDTILYIIYNIYFQFLIFQ